MSNIFSKWLTIGIGIVACVWFGYAQAQTPQGATSARFSVAPQKIAPVTPLRLRNKLTEQDGYDRKAIEDGLDFVMPIGVHVGTLGFGGFIGLCISPFFATRLFISQYKYTTNANLNFGGSAIPGSIALKLDYHALLLDYYPFAGSFRITAGMFANNTSASVHADVGVDESVPFGDETITFTESGKVTGTLAFVQSHVPYFGIGFGNYAVGSPFTFALDLGMVLQGDAEIKVGHSGFTNTVLINTLDQQISAAQKQLNNGDGLSFLRKYPVIQMSFAYSFDI